MGLAPKQRLVAGIVGIVAGVGLTIGLLGRGLLWGLPLFGLVLGMFLCWSGLSGIARQRKRRELVQSVAANREELLTAMISAKEGGPEPRAPPE